MIIILDFKSYIIITVKFLKELIKKGNDNYFRFEILYQLLYKTRLENVMHFEERIVHLFFL